MRIFALLLMSFVVAACAAVPQITAPPPLPTATVPQPTPTTVPATATVAASPIPQPTNEHTAGWREDLQSLSQQLQRHHPDLYWRTSEEEFQAMVADLHTRIPTLSDSQIIVELARIVSLADGHTFLPLFQSAVGFQLYPLRFYQFSDGLYVVSADDPYGDLVGTRVIQIGHLSAEEAFAAVASLVPHDNDMTLALLTPVYLRVPEVLLALGIVDDLSQPGFVLEKPNGARTTVNAAPIPAGRYQAWVSTYRSLAGLPSASEPLWLSRKDREYFWYTFLEDSNTLYVQYNLVWDATQSGQTIEDFTAEVDAFATAHEPERTIVDVRHNIGGDNYKTLARALLDNEHINQAGRLFVLIGRQTFSAAILFSANLDEKTHAQLVGEPTGGPPNFYGNNIELTLPNSGIQFLVSTKFRTGLVPGDTRPWLAPDRAVELTAADYFAGRDPVLEAALAADETP